MGWALDILNSGRCPRCMLKLEACACRDRKENHAAIRRGDA